MRIIKIILVVVLCNICNEQAFSQEAYTNDNGSKSKITKRVVRIIKRLSMKSVGTAIGEMNNIEIGEPSQKKSTIKPNPTSGPVSINIQLQSKCGIDIIISDITGSELLRKSVMAEIGENTYNLDLTDLQNGYYFINFIGNNGFRLCEPIIKY